MSEDTGGLPDRFDQAAGYLGIGPTSGERYDGAEWKLKSFCDNDG
jgi:hypothetical protein